MNPEESGGNANLSMLDKLELLCIAELKESREMVHFVKSPLNLYCDLQ